MQRGLGGRDKEGRRREYGLGNNRGIGRQVAGGRLEGSEDKHRGDKSSPASKIWSIRKGITGEGTELKRPNLGFRQNQPLGARLSSLRWLQQDLPVL